MTPQTPATPPTPASPEGASTPEESPELMISLDEATRHIMAHDKPALRR